MLLLLGAAAPATGGCLADCDENGAVAIDELVTAVAVALGDAPAGACPAFACAPPSITIGCLVRAVGNALLGCPSPTETPVDTCTATATIPPPPTRTPTVTGTPTRTCAAPPSPPDCPPGEGAAGCSDPQCFVACGCGTVTPTATPTNSCTPGGGNPPPGCIPEGPTNTATPQCHLPTPTPTPTPSLPPSRCRSAADCDPSSQRCLEVGGFAGCGICYPDDVIDTEFQRCGADIECAPRICQPLGDASRTCSACHGPASVCMDGCAGDGQCEPGYRCAAGRCTPPACESDPQCPAQHSCVTGGRCQRTACTTDAACGGGFCVNGGCRPEPGICTLIPG